MPETEEIEGMMGKYGGPLSPTPPRRKIPVLYYLCRNRHLEQPHFMEVPLSSLEGLYLRDVINRLNVLRGKGMPAMYSWSCKRNYKNGFVWHDLSKDDLIFPTNGNEFVLKGSELLEQSPLGKEYYRLQNLNVTQSETPTSSRTNETSSSSSQSPQSQCLLANQVGYPNCPSPKAASPSLAERRVCKSRIAADASTQTDDGGRRAPKSKNACNRGVSTDDMSVDFEHDRSWSNQAVVSKEESEPCGEKISPPPTSSSSSSGRKMETLESLIRADADVIKGFHILEEDEILIPTAPRLKATNVLMQLITCGSIAVKDHQSFGLVPTYKPKFSNMNTASPMFSNTTVTREFDCFSENPKYLGLRLEDKEYFSGSLLETKKHKEDIRESLPTLKRSSSFNSDRRDDERFEDSSRLKCFPQPSKKLSTKQPSIPDSQRNSSAAQDCNGSKRFSELSPIKGSFTRPDSLTEDEQRTIKVEERLISGARVIIQSRAS